MKIAVALVIALITVWAVQHVPSPSISYPNDQTAPLSSCEHYWTTCNDNSDMANHNTNYALGRAQCKMAANNLAKYGEPMWPQRPFGSYRLGTDYSSGHVTMIEPDAKFENILGGKVRSKVVCNYNMDTMNVIDIVISDR